MSNPRIGSWTGTWVALPLWILAGVAVDPAVKSLITVGWVAAVVSFVPAGSIVLAMIAASWHGRRFVVSGMVFDVLVGAGVGVALTRSDWRSVACGVAALVGHAVAVFWLTSDRYARSAVEKVIRREQEASELQTALAEHQADLVDLDKQLKNRLAQVEKMSDQASANLAASMERYAAANATVDRAQREAAETHHLREQLLSRVDNMSHERQTEFQQVIGRARELQDSAMDMVRKAEDRAAQIRVQADAYAEQVRLNADAYAARQRGGLQGWSPSVDPRDLDDSN
jgi:signal transduction histidine kinase